MVFPQNVATQGFLNSPLSIAGRRGFIGRPATRYTYFALLEEARQLLGDEAINECALRYPDVMLVNGLNRGMQELARIRPDAFYDLYDANDLNVPCVTVNTVTVPVVNFPQDVATQGFLDSPLSISAVRGRLMYAQGGVNWGAPFPLHLRFWPPLVHYVVGMTEVSEDEYVTGGMRNPYGSRAAGNLRMFRRHVLSV